MKVFLFAVQTKRGIGSLRGFYVTNFSGFLADRVSSKFFFAADDWSKFCYINYDGLHVRDLIQWVRVGSGSHLEIAEAICCPTSQQQQLRGHGPGCSTSSLPGLLFLTPSSAAIPSSSLPIESGCDSVTRAPKDNTPVVALR